MEDIKNKDLDKVVEKVTPIKTWLVDYVGNKLQPSNGEVTVEMLINVMADEFPEFVLCVAEENFIRGYKQAFADIESKEKNE
jgi:hypothetical protein